MGEKHPHMRPWWRLVASWPLLNPFLIWVEDISALGTLPIWGRVRLELLQEEDLLIVILHLSGQPAEPYARDIERVTLHIPFVCNHALYIVCPNLCLQVCCVPGKRSDGSVVICAHKYLEHEGSRCQCLERCILFERST
jgi:hypothetical protein